MMSPEDLGVVAQSLRFRANWIETGDHTVNASECENYGVKPRALCDDQKRLVLRLRRLANQVDQARTSRGSRN